MEPQGSLKCCMIYGMALTDSAVKRAQTKSKPYRISDSPGGVRGLYIRIMPSGEKTWALRYTDIKEEKRRYHSFGSYPSISLAEARDEARELKAKVKRGEPLIKTSNDDVAYGTVEQLLTGYWEDLQQNNKKSWSQVKDRCERHVIPHIGDKQARDITEDDVIGVLSRIYAKGHKAMANRVRSYMKTAWKWGKRHDRDYRFTHKGIRFGIIVNPVDDIPRDGNAENVDDRVLSWSEIKSLFHACQDVISLPMRIACELMLITGGQRPGEIIGMKEEELDLKNRVWLLPGERTKNGKPHIVPLTDFAIEKIDQARKYRVSDNKKGKANKSSQYIFPMREDNSKSMRNDSLYTAVRRYCQNTGFVPWTPKDLRTTFKTRGGEIGLSKEIRDRIQNHAFSDVSSKHYDMWTYLPEKRAALEEWEQKLRTIV